MPDINSDPPIRNVASGFDVRPLVAQIEAAPSIWNRYRVRTEGYGAHSDVSDIWVRYNAWENYGGDLAAFNAEHESAWYPVVTQIPAVKPLVFDVMRAVEGERLGGVLITRIPAGKMCKPHRDGGWHATYYEKYAVQLASAPGQAFCFEDAQLSAAPGDLYTFDNSKLHWVTNTSEADRMSLIICIRRSH